MLQASISGKEEKGKEKASANPIIGGTTGCNLLQKCSIFDWRTHVNTLKAVFSIKVHSKDKFKSCLDFYDKISRNKIILENFHKFEKYS